MKHAICILCLALLLATASLAQTPDPQHGPMGMPGFNLQAPRALMGDWWRDSEVINELHLTDAQRTQLEQASVNMKLALINAGAAGATALVKAESTLNSQQLNEAGYTQDVNALAEAASNLVKDLGTSMLAMRKILTPEQWQKLQMMRRSERMRMRERPMEHHNERPNDGMVPRQ